MKETQKVRVDLELKQNHTNIYAALSAFQGELKPMAKSGHVEFQTNSGKTMKFDYTPLGEIMTTIYPLLAKHGLAVRHEISKEGVEAILTHETYKIAADMKEREIVDSKTIESFFAKVEGEIRSGIVTLKGGNEMKDTGAAITYARRYTLTMVLGIASEDDKDAELLEQSAQNAVQTVYERFKAGVEKAKTVAEIDKQMGVLKKDLATLDAGKAPALGLRKEQYEDLLKLGEAHKQNITNGENKDIE